MRLFGVEHPIVQAPMGGGVGTPDLVAAASNAGALGSLAGGYLSAAQIAEAAAAVRARTDRPFAINLFAPGDTPAPAEVDAMLALLAPIHRELGIAPPAVPARVAEPFEEQLAAVLATRPAVFSFTFGVPTPDALAACRAAGMVLVGTATTVAEAVALERAGVDAVVAQGSEAGGQRGTFLGPYESGLVGTIALVPQVVDAVAVPVIAAGGIMDGRGVAAARALGAAAVQLGTAFLTCRESGVPPAYRAAVASAGDDATTLSRAFTGRLGRLVRNRFLEAVPDGAVAPFPLQNALTRPMRSVAAARGDAGLLSLFAGQGVGLARALPAAELIRRLVAEAEAACARRHPHERSAGVDAAAGT